MRTFTDDPAEVLIGITAGEVAASIAPSLAKKTISASINGAHCDLAWPITQDAKIIFGPNTRADIVA